MSKKALCVLKSDIISDEALNSNSDVIITPNALTIFTIQTYLLDRSICETNEHYLQIIPYITLIDEDTGYIFVYKRGNSSGEERLLNNHSLGLGGHIELQPNNEVSLKTIVLDETMRELTEEVGLLAKDYLNCINYKYETNNFGLIYMRSSEVEKVHIGLSMFLKINRKHITDLEKNVICNGVWLPIEEIKNKIINKEISLENWSKLVFDIIIKENNY
jgi:predicted NUDIX family phosphoesterase